MPDVTGTVESVAKGLGGLKIDGAWYAPKPGVPRLAEDQLKKLVNEKVTLKLSDDEEFTTSYEEIYMNGEPIINTAPKKAKKAKTTTDDKGRKVATIVHVNKTKGSFKADTWYFPENEEVALDSAQLEQLIDKKVVFVPGEKRGLTPTYREIISVDEKSFEDFFYSKPSKAEKEESKKVSETKKNKKVDKTTEAAKKAENKTKDVKEKSAKETKVALKESSRPEKEKTEKEANSESTPTVWDKKDRRISRQVCLERAMELLTHQKDKFEAQEVIKVAREFEKYVYEGLE